MYQNPKPYQSFSLSLFSSFALLLLLFACQPKAQTAEKPEAENPELELEVEQKKVRLVSKNCNQDSNRCATFEIDYPVLKTQTPGTKTINDSIEHYVKYGLDLNSEGRKKGSSIRDLGLAFIQEYETFVADQTADGNTDYITSWFMECDAMLSYQSPKAVSVMINKYTFAGGAHPNTYVSMLNFDLNSGKTLSLKDLVTDLKKLNALAEQKFREVRELSANEDFNDAGYFWSGSFQLPENFSLDKNGLQFFYNTYEVASYADGPTEFLLTWQELDGIVKMELIE
jgi:Deacetylase PdaC/Protein of unknown function (DUF3298)